MAAEIARRELPIAIVGIPKTIDNDIKYCWRTFGFVTAVAEAEKAIDRAHVEAKAVRGGIGLVKLMGREAGFITAAAALASGETNFALIPEVPFELHGPDGFLTRLQQRMEVCAITPWWSSPKGPVSTCCPRRVRPTMLRAIVD